MKNGTNLNADHLNFGLTQPNSSMAGQMYIWQLMLAVVFAFFSRIRKRAAYHCIKKKKDCSL